MFRKAYGFLFATVAVIIMAAPAMAVGFATTSYAASTIVSGNNVSSDYIIAGLYTKNDFTIGVDYEVAFEEEDFTAISEAKFNSCEIRYTEESSVKKIVEDIYTLTPDNLYLVVQNSRDISFSYNLSFSYSLVDCGDLNDPNDDTEITGINCTIYLGNGQYPVTSSDSFAGGYAYHLQFNAAIPETTISSTNVTGHVTIDSVTTTQYSTHGVVVETHACDLEIESVTVLDDVEVSGGDYDLSRNTESGYSTVLVTSETNTGTHNGVTDGDGHINVDLSVPENIYFCIKVRNYSTSAVYINILIKDGNTVIYDNTEHSSYENGYWVGKYEKIFFGTAGPTNKLSTISNVSNPQWLMSTTGSISVHMTDVEGRNMSQDFTLEVLFRDAPQ